MPVLAATATGKIVEGIVPPIKVGLLVPASRRGTVHRGAVSSSGYGCERTSVLDSSCDGPVFTPFSALPSALSFLRVSPGRG
jgi:hypothetical protein